MSELSREFQDGELVPGTRYRVISLLGAGGMGTVYEVEHTELGKRFVLKALFRELARRKDLVGRLRNEWRALGQLAHANIVNVTDAGTSDTGVPFYVMERLEGETLAARMRSRGRFSLQEALPIAAQILEGLSAAHEIGIVHRDIKPPNIYLVGKVVKILDFGIAKIASSTGEVITARGVAIGTPRYMSPEQARGERVDGRADLYAAGLILYEMLTGRGPFDDARDANETLLAQIGQVPARPSTVVSVPQAVDDLVCTLLAKDPRARPASARPLAATLRDVLKRVPSIASTDAPTPDARYQAATVAGEAQALAAPSTRPDGVAGRRSVPGVTTRVEPLEDPKAPVAEGEPTFVDPAMAATAMSAMEPPSDVTERVGEASLPAPPSDAGRRRVFDRTLTIEEAEAAKRASEPPAETRTAVPLESGGGATPPPVIQSARERPRSALLPLAMGLGALLLVAGVGGSAWLVLANRGGASEVESAAPASSPATSELGPTTSAHATTPEPAPADSAAATAPASPAAAPDASSAPMEKPKENPVTTADKPSPKPDSNSQQKPVPARPADTRPATTPKTSAPPLGLPGSGL